MSRIIIFEGHDNAGKTSIATNFADGYNYQYFKSHMQAKHFKEGTFLQALRFETDYLLDFLEQVNVAGNGLIIDRHLPSEFAYSYAYHRLTDLNYIWEADEKLAKLGACVIYCYKDKVDNFEDHLIDESKVEPIKEGYEYYFQKTKMKHLILNTSDENLLEQLDKIQRFLNETYSYNAR
jgi:hypothetical protein